MVSAIGWSGGWVAVDDWLVWFVLRRVWVLLSALSNDRSIISFD